MPPPDEPLQIRVRRLAPRPVDAAALAVLSAEERERVAAFRRQADAARFVTARLVARTMLGARLGVAPAAVELVVPERGWKPRVPGSPVELSIAHAGDVVLVAVAEGVEIGVDVEEARAVARGPERELWRTIAADEERAAGDPEDAVDRTLRAFVRKEAVLKAVRLGLSVPMADLVLEDADPPRVLRTPAALPDPEELVLLDLPAPAGTRSALAAVTRGPVEVRDDATGALLARTRADRADVRTSRS